MRKIKMLPRCRLGARHGTLAIAHRRSQSRIAEVSRLARLASLASLRSARSAACLLFTTHIMLVMIPLQSRIAEVSRLARLASLGSLGGQHAFFSRSACSGPCANDNAASLASLRSARSAAYIWRAPREFHLAAVQGSDCQENLD